MIVAISQRLALFWRLRRRCAFRNDISEVEERLSYFFNTEFFIHYFWFDNGIALLLPVHEFGDR